MSGRGRPWRGVENRVDRRQTGESQLVGISSRGHSTPSPRKRCTFGAGAEKAGEARFYPIVTDHLGTPKEMFDERGECLWQAEHSLWGKTSVAWQKMRKQSDGAGKETQADSPWPAVECNLRFQNQWEDEETGLYYNLNRYYDPDSGQYLSTDPIGLEGGLRTHGYVHDPMQWVDPLGLCKAPRVGQKVYRIFGEKNNPFGESWTPVDPRTATNYRSEAGLPGVNTGRFALEGRIKDSSGIKVRRALPLDGNPGGLTEYLIPDAKSQVSIERVSGVNPEF